MIWHREYSNIQSHGTGVPGPSSKGVINVFGNNWGDTTLGYHKSRYRGYVGFIQTVSVNSIIKSIPNVGMGQSWCRHGRLTRSY